MKRIFIKLSKNQFIMRYEDRNLTSAIKELGRPELEITP